MMEEWENEIICDITVHTDMSMSLCDIGKQDQSITNKMKEWMMEEWEMGKISNVKPHELTCIVGSNLTNTSLPSIKDPLSLSMASAARSAEGSLTNTMPNKIQRE